MPEDKKPYFRYEVTCVRSGQPRPYADHIYEYIVKCERFQTYGMPEERDKWHPFLMGGDIDAAAARERADVEAGRLIRLGYVEDAQLLQKRLTAQKTHQTNWAITICRALCRDFKVKGDPQYGGLGQTSLVSIKLDPAAGTIHVVMSEPFTD